ncbi:hypothetical protein ACO1O0_000526 [Amphichorda felina]
MLSYRPLEQLQSEIRLVRFKFASEPSTHDSDSTSIQLELRHASLDDSDTRYAALSYVWGDATDYREIYVNDSVFRIGRNLHDALFQLRRMDVSSWLWIDSICIQQSDIEEKTWQVSLMRSVFSLAEMVRSRNPDGKTLDEQRSSVLRKVMRGEPIDTDQLSEEQEEYIRNGLYWIRARNPEHDLNDHLEFLRTSFTNSLGASSRERTLFKTEKTMLGMGHVAIRTGDIVTLMEGLPSPIILRPRGEDKGGGFTFVGDAYVDGIMYGEFLETHPTWRDFEIY